MDPFFKKIQITDEFALKEVSAKIFQLTEEKIYPKSFSMPISLQFEVTSRCNLSCKHCYNNSGRTTGCDAMSGQWGRICREIVDDGGIFNATISGGEPLLLGDELFDIMDILSSDGTVFNLISNGYFLDQNLIKRFLDYRFFWIQISIDSSREKIHDTFRGLNGAWRNAVRAANLISNSGIKLRIACTLTPETLQDIPEICLMAESLGASYLIFSDVMYSGRAFDNSNIFLKDYQREEMVKTIKVMAEKYKRKGMEIIGGGSIKTQLKYASIGAIHGAIIRPDGNLKLDCTAPFVIGNVLNKRLSHIWAELDPHCWKNEIVKNFIESTDYTSGRNNFIRNYYDDDINLVKFIHS